MPDASGVSVRDVRREYGSVVALSGLDLEVTQNSRVGIVGSSGCGKST